MHLGNVALSINLRNRYAENGRILLFYADVYDLSMLVEGKQNN